LFIKKTIGWKLWFFGKLSVFIGLIFVLVACGSNTDVPKTFEGRLALETAPELGVVINKEDMTIIGVATSSAAEKAGIKPGDVLKKVDNVEVITTDVAKQKIQSKALQKSPDEQKVSLVLNRTGQEVVVNAQLTPRGGTANQPTPTPVPTQYDYL
jgi:S1-C subfamily serine protease